MPTEAATHSSAADDAQTVLVQLPTRRDNDTAVHAMKQLGIQAKAVASLQDLILAIPHAVGAVLISEMVLAHAEFEALLDALERQPPWSDVPVVLSLRSDVSDRVRHRQQRLANVTLLDRPTSVRTLTSAIQAALRARNRQYEIRGRIEALEQAEMALRESDRRKDTFLATLAHELRNPLAPIRNAAYLLAKTPVDSERFPRLIAMVDRQSQGMALLLDDLMDIARVTSGKLVLRPAPVTLRAVVSSAVEAARPLLDQKQHFFRVNVPEREITWRVDGLRISQVLTNLLTNAAKYTGNGGHIELMAAVDADGVEVSVRDDGVGISPELLPRIFEMFEQVRDTLNQAQGGLGIGLALARSLTEMHGGTLDATSEGKGHGATFTMWLPATVLLEEGAADAPSTQVPDHAHASRKCSVMVVDDNVDAAASLSMALKAAGYPVEVCHSPVQALQTARALRPRVMMLDIGMPEMDGYQLAGRIRAEDWGGDVRLIALTGWGQPGDKQRAKEAGFDEHLTKPVSPSVIERTIATLSADG